MKGMLTKRNGVAVVLVVLVTFWSLCNNSGIFEQFRLMVSNFNVIDVQNFVEWFFSKNLLALVAIALGIMAIITGIVILRQDSQIKELKRKLEEKDKELKQFQTTTSETNLLEKEQKEQLVKMYTDQLAELNCRILSYEEEIENYKKTCEEELEKYKETCEYLTQQLLITEKFFERLEKLHPEVKYFRNELEAAMEEEEKAKADEVDRAYRYVVEKDMSLSYPFQFYKLLNDKEKEYLSPDVIIDMQRYAETRDEKKVM